MQGRLRGDVRRRRAGLGGGGGGGDGGERDQREGKQGLLHGREALARKPEYRGRGMDRSAPVDGFSLAYERAGSGPPVVLLHGWPGDHTDHEEVVPLLTSDFEVVVPDLRGFGESDKHLEPPGGGLLGGRPGAQRRRADRRARARRAGDRRLRHRQPDRAGDRPRHAREGARARRLAAAARGRPAHPQPRGRCASSGTRALHQLPLIEQILDGDPVAVRAYLSHFWNHWSGPDYTPTDARLDHLAAAYGEPGAMTASVGWYRAGSGGVAASAGRAGPGARASGSPRPPRCCGRSTTRSSRARGRTASTCSSATSTCAARRRRALHARSRRRRRSRRRSGSGASSRSPAARRARCPRGPSAPPSPPGGRAR